jgi:hypothetical protein
MAQLAGQVVPLVVGHPGWGRAGPDGGADAAVGLMAEGVGIAVPVGLDAPGQAAPRLACGGLAGGLAQLGRARRLAALRTRTLLRQEFGDVDTARTLLTRLVNLLAQLDADKVQEDAEDEPERPKAKKRAIRKPLGDPTG